MYKHSQAMPVNEQEGASSNLFLLPNSGRDESQLQKGFFYQLTRKEKAGN